MRLQPLLQPRSVAIIGASVDAGKTSGRPVAYLQKHGFAGAIYPVNPRVARIGDLTCFPDVASLPEVPDVAIVLLGASQAHLAVGELAAKGCGAAIVLASGYSETGEQGAHRQAELARARGTMRLLGPNTIGLVNLTDRIVLSASSALEMDHFPTGNLAVISQSGGILGSLLSRASARGIGLSKLVSTSNELDIDLADVMEDLVDDPATAVIALYIESVRHPERFRAAAQRAREAGKPVVAYKIGRSEAGARAAASHTGAMAGEDRMYDAFFSSLGIQRAQTFSELLDIPCALATGRRLRGKRVAILTSTGGAGTLVSDALGVAGFETPAPDSKTGERLRALQPGDHAAMDRNPIDVTLAGLQPALLRGAIQTLLDSPGYDALALIVGSSGLSQPELMAGAIGACLPGSDKPVVAYVSPSAPTVAAVLTQRGVPAFMAPESCAVAIGALWHREGPALERGAPLYEAPAVPLPTNEALLASLPTGTLDEAQSKRLFSRAAITCTPEEVVSDAGQAEAAARRLGEPVVLKLLSSTITHKSDMGGVALGQTASSIGARLEQMRQAIQTQGTAIEKFLVQAQVRGGTEMILGMHRDALGTAILLGMGGITAELFEDTTLQMLPPGQAQGSLRPLTRAEAMAMARRLKTWPLLAGYRGRPPADQEALVSAIVQFSALVAQLGDRLAEAEINPLFVLDGGQGVVAADGVVRLAIPA